MTKHPEYADIIDLGLDKLKSYEDCTLLCPAYELAMSMSHYLSTREYFILMSYLVLDPSVKLRWLTIYQPE
jgi:hypothetical protein